MSKSRMAETHKKKRGKKAWRLISKKKRRVEIPSEEIVESELKRIRSRSRLTYTLRSTAFSLLVAAAVAVLVASLWLPVLRIYGRSMAPTLTEGQIVVTARSNFSTGDIVGLFVGNHLVIKRVIAEAGQWVNIDTNGNVFVDGKLLNEPYITEKAFGDCNIALPYQVPDGRYFVMGDHRATSLDSRNTAVGCIAEEEIVGRVIFRVWPLDKLGRVDR